jgi:hypothetical protein
LALASLIIGCAVLDDGITPRAALPFLGQSLIEYQVRQAAAAGAKHIVILVERVPAALVGAIDRLKREGVGVELARTVADAADRIHPDEQLLLIGDGVVARQDVLKLVAHSRPATLFTVADSGVTMRHERIDAGSRWSGLALIDGTMLRRTVAMLGDWDLQSTLLRRIVQAQPHRTDSGAASVWLIDSIEHGRAAEIALLGGSGWLLPAGAGERLSAFLLDRDVRSGWFRGASLGLAAAAIPMFSLGWFTLGALLLTLSGPVAAIPQRLDAVGLRTAGAERTWRWAQAGLFALALLAMGWKLDESGAGWGVWTLAFGAIGLGGLLWDQARLTGRDPVQPSLLATPLLLSVLGMPVLGMAGSALLTGGLLAVRQRQLGNRDDHEIVGV